MKISAFVFLLSLLANLSFASLSAGLPTTQGAIENKDTVSRDGLKVNLLGDWTNIGEGRKKDSGFTSLSFLASGKFIGTTSSDERVCGFWEVSADGLSLVLHKTCETTGERTETTIAQIELVDGHMMTLTMPNDKGGKQMFIQ